MQYIVRNGKKLPLPGGPADPDGEFNAIVQAAPGADPVGSNSSYIQVVTWKSGDSCPEAATILTYSESDNPDSPLRRPDRAVLTPPVSHRSASGG